MKYSIILLLLLLVLTSCSVNHGGDASLGESESESERLTDEPKETTEALSESDTASGAENGTETNPTETIYLWYTKTDITEDDLEIGMTSSEYRSLVPQTQYMSYDGYYFLVDRNGDTLVIKFDGNPYAITEFRTYPKRNSLPSAEDFTKIKIDMDMFEVIELLGLPHSSDGSGIIYLFFSCADGIYRSIYTVHNDTIVGIVD